MLKKVFYKLDIKKMKFQYLQFELSSAIGVLTIDRQRSLNALNSEVLDELESFAKQAEEKKELLVLIITGAGKSFVAGADIKEMVDFDQKQAEAFSKKGQKVFSLIESLPFPVIAVVNGFALGGGLELALACDILLMSEIAKVGLPEVTLGLLPAFGGTQRLIRAVGLYKAKEMIFSGNVYTTQEAVTMGLINKVVAPSELMTAALLLAEDIKQRGPSGVMKAKKLIHEEDNFTLQDRLQKEAEEFGKLFNSHEAKEGMQAFLEKRKPNFKSI